MTRKPEKKGPLVIGLTGSIGMGKSAAADIFRSLGLPVFCADCAVHALLMPGGRAAGKVARQFPLALDGGGINRKLLGQAVFSSPRNLRRLEEILHPLVRNEERKFIAQAKRSGGWAAVLEIPLLFETGAERRCDVTVCVTASRAAQKRRVLARPGMTEAKFRAVAKLQMPDVEKRRRAGHIINTGQSRAGTRRQIKQLLAELRERNGKTCAK